MPFVRVKSAVKTDPQHEYDVSVDEYEANKSDYTLLDGDPVPEPREPLYVTAPAKKPTRKKPGETDTAPDGADS